MRAAVLVSPTNIADIPLTIMEVPAPELKPGHVLLKVEACGLCRTDLHIVEGELPPRIQNLIPGHQIVGRVTSGETRNFLSERVWVCPGSAAWTANALIARRDSRTFATHQRSLVTRFMEATLSSQLHDPTSSSRCRQISMTFMQPLFFALGSLDFEV